MASGLTLTLLGCQKEEVEKTDEEIIEEMENAPEIIIPDEPVETYEPKDEPVHFAPPSGHWCVCQRTLGGADGHLLFHRFPIYHNVVVFGNSLEN